MKKKLNPWFWLAVFSTGGGMALGLFVPLHDGDFEVGDFAWPQILLRFAFFLTAAFVVTGLLFLIFKWSRRFLRRLFTWRILKWCLRALGILLVLISLFYAEENWRGRHAWEKYKQEWEAKGEKFDFASFIPPPVPDEQNFALTPIVAGSYGSFLDQNGHRLKSENTNVVNRLNLELYRRYFYFPDSTNMPLRGWQTGKLTDLKTWQAYYRTMFVTNRFAQGMPSMPMPGAIQLSGRKIVETNETEEVTALATNEFPVASQPQSPAADVLLALSKYDSVIEELRQASRLPLSRFPLNYDAPSPSEILIPHLAALKSCAQVLQLRACAELASDQNQKALADIKLALRLAESVQSEPSLYPLNTRRTIVNLAIQPVWEGLVLHQWTDQQLAELEDEFAKLNLVQDYSYALRSELASNLKSIEDLRTEHMTNSITDMNGDIMWIPTLIYRLAPSGWFYLNAKAVSHIFDAALPTGEESARQNFSPELGQRIGRAEFIDHRRHWIPDNFLVSFMVPPLEREARTCAKTQAAIDSARLACALERYRQVHGDYPKTLDAVAPQFIGKIPHDIINGQPLHYRRTEDGNFLLYSVGWNGKDDGGVSAKDGIFNFSEKDGDWVWPFSVK
jgi:hypothetical protein